jgi:mRNA interferase RelE/StbE
VSLRVVYEEKAIDQAAGFLADDPGGVRAVLDAVDQLADDPRPDGSFPYGSPDLRRLRVGQYRVMYEIKDDVGVPVTDVSGAANGADRAVCPAGMPTVQR